MSNLRPFQLVLLGLSVVMVFMAVIVLAIYEPETEVDLFPFPTNVQIWGTFEPDTITPQLGALSLRDDRYKEVRYTQLTEENFVPEFVNALAEGRGPDLVLIPHDLLVELRPKLQPLSYDFYDRRTFYNSFVDGAEIFARSDGVYAMPVAVDPLVMYWNRDTFSSNNIALPPTTWEQLRNDVVPRLTRLSTTRDVLHSGVAFGEYRNVRNAQEVLALLFMQSGSEMVRESEGRYTVALNQSAGSAAQTNPATSALGFYTEFSNPTSGLYSWNRSLPEDRSSFLSGDLALYFGYGSELDALERANPNLNFDMAPVPQGEGATVLRGYGRFYGFAIPMQARDKMVSYTIANALVQPDLVQQMVTATDMAPVHRVAVAAPETDPYQQIRNTAALIARAWLTPGDVVTDDVFLNMVEDVTSGRLGAGSAVGSAGSRLKLGF